MAIVACGECGGDVSDKAAKCPHCGHDRMRQRNQVALIALAVALAFGAWMIYQMWSVTN